VATAAAVRAAPLPGEVDEVTGTVVRVSVDGYAEGPRSSGIAAMATWLVTGRGRTQVPTSDLAGVPTGATVRARLGARRTAAGSRPDQLAEAGRTVLHRQVIAGVGTPTAPGDTAVAAASSPHTVTIALVIPPGGAADTMTLTRLESTVESTVSPFWSEQTSGLVTFTVTRRLGWTTTTTGCDDYFGLWNEIAERTGFVWGPRNHLVLYLGGSPSTCYPGLGTVGGSVESGGYLYVNGSSPTLVAHEFGHNLSLGHSNGLQCDRRPDGRYSSTTRSWTNSCTRREYRDYYDVMGVSWDQLGSLSTFHAQRLGVLAAGQISTVTASSLVTLRPVSGHTGLVSLRVDDPDGGRYVVEYRPASGRDAWLANDSQNWPGLRQGVLIRRVDPTDDAESLLLDGTPTVPLSWSTDFDTALQPGGSLTTWSGRVVIKVVTVSGSRATVLVQVDGKSPTPTVTVLPPTDPERIPRVPLTDPVTTTNRPRTAGHLPRRQVRTVSATTIRR